MYIWVCIYVCMYVCLIVRLFVSGMYTVLWFRVHFILILLSWLPDPYLKQRFPWDIFDFHIG